MAWTMRKYQASSRQSDNRTYSMEYPPGLFFRGFKHKKVSKLEKILKRAGKV